LNFVLLTSRRADRRAREAQAVAAQRLTPRVERVDDRERVHRLRALAGEAKTTHIVIVDADVVPVAGAFASLRHALESGPALLGGRALIGATQRFGAMFGAVRSGPNPFEFVPLMGGQTEARLGDLMRGRIDVPQRGMLVVATDFMRELGDAGIEPETLHLDLAVHARLHGRAVRCEPSVTFACDEDEVALKRRAANLRRFSAARSWRADELHREPPNLRPFLIGRETRVAGNFRGFARRPVPPVETVIAGGAGAAPADVDAVRAALAVCRDDYLLCAEAGAVPPADDVQTLVERIERSGRFVLAVNGERPYRAFLVHRGRAVDVRSAFETIDGMAADLIARLPAQRLYAVDGAGPIVPATLPPPRSVEGVEFIFVAASQPAVTNQAIQSFLADVPDGAATVVYPAGSETVRKLLAPLPSLRPAPDAVDPILAVGLNERLARVRADAVLVVRDDAQLTLGAVARLRDAFRRMPRLGAAVPRVGGDDRPEGIPGLGYRNVMEMQAYADRRGELFARETQLTDCATTPVVMISREALARVGGFDETFGFSRLGMEDFTRRLQSANFLVARCDDAYVHLFPAEQTQSLFATVDASPHLRACFAERWAQRREFDPGRDRVALREGRDRAERAERAVHDDALRVLVPIADEDEWNDARPIVAAIAEEFRAHDPVEIAIGLDGSFALGIAVSAIREILAATGVPLEQTLNVHVDVVGDRTTWRGAGMHQVRVAGPGRPELVDVPSVADVAAVRAHLAVAPA
jgi:hypothetical protein